MSGFYRAGFDVPAAALHFDTAEGLAWYDSSPWARRGGCNRCGSGLFYRLNDGDCHEVAPGAIDGPLGGKLAGHIFVADKGDYYDLTDGLPRHPAAPDE